RALRTERARRLAPDLRQGESLRAEAPGGSGLRQEARAARPLRALKGRAGKVAAEAAAFRSTLEGDEREQRSPRSEGLQVGPGGPLVPGLRGLCDPRRGA